MKPRYLTASMDEFWCY